MSHRRIARICGPLTFLVLACAPTAHAFNYVKDANDTYWGVQDAAAPRVDTASIRATQSAPNGSGAFTTNVNGYGGLRVSVDTSPTPRLNGALMRGFGLTFDGVNRFDTTSAVDLGGVHIQRSLTINRSSDYGRWFDTFTNTTGAPLTVHVAFGGQSGYGSGTSNATSIVGTQSGDTAVDASDGWVDVAAPAPTGTGSAAGDEVTVLGDAGFGGTGDFLHDTFTTPLQTAGHEANFQGYLTTLTIAPGASQSLLHFLLLGPRVTTATVGGARSTLTTQATNLAAKPDLTALTTGQVCSIRNFDAAALGGPDCSAPGSVGLVAAPKAQPTTTSSPYDVVGKSIDALQADMAAGRTTSVQITQAYLDRISAYDQGPFGFNSFEYVAQDALAQAKAADDARAAGRTGRLLGIPFAIKNLYDTKDMPTTNGSLVFAGFRPHDDATQVARLRAAGAVILGKTALEEYATSGNYSNDAWGQVWNAYDPSKSAIASSGGSATATALSLDAASLGSQTGDSLYGPSSGASLVSLRGTDGLESGAGVQPLTFLTDFGGVIARSVGDLADVLDTVAGSDPADPSTAPADAHLPGDWRDKLDPDALKGKRIGLIPSTFVDPFGTSGTTDAELAAAKKYLTAAGATVVTAGTTVGNASDSPTRTAVAPTLPASTSISVEGWDEYIDAHPELAAQGFPLANYRDVQCSQRKVIYTRQDPTSQLCTSPPGARLSAEQVAQYRAYRVALQGDLAAWMDKLGPGNAGVDAVVYPGLLSDISLNDGGGGRPSFGRADTPSASFASPTVIFPAGRNDHGQPVNLQLLGRAWSDPQLVGYAYAFEHVAQPDGAGRQEPTTAPPLPYVPDSTPTTPTEPQTPASAQTPPGPAAGSAPAPSSGAGAPLPKKLRIFLPPRSRATLRDGVVRLEVHNAAQTTVGGHVTLSLKARRTRTALGAVSFNVPAGRRETLRIVLGPKARRRLAGRRHTTVSSAYALSNASGATLVQRRYVRLIASSRG